MDGPLSDEHTLASALRDAGHRITSPRRAVWFALGDEHGHGSGGHFSVDEVAERTQRHGVPVNRATVYRVLALFEELGLVRGGQLDAGGPVRWERAHPDEHFHLRCTACGAVTHHVGTMVTRVREHLEHGHGFHAETVELTVHGHCASCVERERSAQRGTTTTTV